MVGDFPDMQVSADAVFVSVVGLIGSGLLTLQTGDGWLPSSLYRLWYTLLHTE